MTKKEAQRFNLTLCVNKAMVPVDENNTPIASEIVDHGQASHTFTPKIVAGPNKDGMYLIDFPGMFDSKGNEIDILIDMTLKIIVTAAKSVRLVLLTPST